MSYKSGDIITVSERCYANMTSNVRIYRLEDAYDSSDQWRMDLYFTDADGFPTGSLGTAITDAYWGMDQEDAKYGGIFIAPVACKLAHMAVAWYFYNPSTHASDHPTGHVGVVKMVNTDQAPYLDDPVAWYPIAYVSSDEIKDTGETGDRQLQQSSTLVTSADGALVNPGEVVMFMAFSTPLGGTIEAQDAYMIITALFEVV